MTYSREDDREGRRRLGQSAWGAYQGTSDGRMDQRERRAIRDALRAAAGGGQALDSRDEQHTRIGNPRSGRGK